MAMNAGATGFRARRDGNARRQTAVAQGKRGQRHAKGTREKMDWQQVISFLAVAETGSVSRAAERVHRSQPAVSRQLQALEGELGVELLERRGRGVALTPAGRRFAESCSDVRGRFEEAVDELRTWQSGERGILTTGASVTACVYVLPPSLARMREQHPGIEVRLTTARSADIPDLVRRREVDIGVASAPEPPRGLAFHVLRTIRLMLLAGRGSELPEEAIAPSFLRDRPFVRMTRGTTGRLIQQFEAREGFPLKTAAETDSLEVVKQLVALGFGISMVPDTVVGDTDRAKGLVLREIGGDSIEAQLGVLTRPGRTSPPIERYLALIGAEADNHAARV